MTPVCVRAMRSSLFVFHGAEHLAVKSVYCTLDVAPDTPEDVPPAPEMMTHTLRNGISPLEPHIHSEVNALRIYGEVS